MRRRPSSSRARVHATCALAAQGRPTLAPLRAHARLSRIPTSRTCCANGRPLRAAVRLDVGRFLRARWLLDDRRSARWWPACCRWSAHDGAAGCRKLWAAAAANHGRCLAPLGRCWSTPVAQRCARWPRACRGRVRPSGARDFVMAAAGRPPLRRRSGDVVTADFF
ncbi:beta-galactosidase 1 [Dorcoceras hygrometricum]|uniref:Beta-galactosidase 1 n=1 Tax=Dorcoceras hygrometricum TaxID=472368 RepID=A0A2Z6ZTC6_9LAMI|nr:beta-galactosidase 1 [Dorcoceras hygrometricum]